MALAATISALSFLSPSPSLSPVVAVCRPALVPPACRVSRPFCSPGSAFQVGAAYIRVGFGSSKEYSASHIQPAAFHNIIAIRLPASCCSPEIEVLLGESRTSITRFCKQRQGYDRCIEELPTYLQDHCLLPSFVDVTLYDWPVGFAPTSANERLLKTTKNHAVVSLEPRQSHLHFLVAPRSSSILQCL